MKDFKMSQSHIERLNKEFNRPVITDGIVDFESYKNASKRILWILKEPNSNGDDPWDMCEAIKEIRTENGIRKGWEKTFQKIVYVTNGIINDIPWSDELFHPGHKPEVIDELRKIAYINIKKTGGGARVIEQELWDHYEFSKDLIFEQINSFEPQIIIFGGTYKYFNEDLSIKDFTSFGSCDAAMKEGVIYIHAYHPSYTISEESYVGDILKAVKHFWK